MITQVFISCLISLAVGSPLREGLPTQGREVLPTEGREVLPTQGREVLPTQGREELPTRGRLHYPTEISGSPSFPLYETKPQPYSFSFDVKDQYGSSLTRKEDGDELGNKRGSYGYVDAYGISRQVDYVADDKGFRAVVKTNEPGIGNQNPANVEILSEAVKYQEPSVYRSPSVPVSVPSDRTASANDQPVSAASLVSRQPLGPVYPVPSSQRAVSVSYSPATNQSAVSPHNKARLE